ncbi:hypothetical protein DNX69_09845 [Rhodopseudomonas palustris]|uniref:Uncharacterized protein n=1 Tax=Rhodopseudomonas palustris TaxID=1076 RepID=A0A323UX31_RHOPL|nr:hypothetical protein [Rhodopseudomonas palustris]PZA12288.1 hypothetical protein DNX69_09845 [Rhodopseudomonas palustris]
MDWATWSASLDRILHSPNFPMLVTVAVAAFVALLLLIALLRADKSVANGALVIITLGAIGLAGYGLYRTPGSALGGAAPVSADAKLSNVNAVPALACIDDLAGDMVLSACERVLFSSPDTVAAAVSYASTQLARLTAFGDVAAADKRMTPELSRLRRAVERDRYGLIAYVLVAQDHCQASECAAFRSLTDSSRIAANMGEHLYETTLTRYAPSWGTPAAAGADSAASTPTPPSPGLAGVTEAPSGKPTDIDFPTSASIPAVSIMAPEPGQGAAAAKPAAPATHNGAANAKANPSATAKRPPAPAHSPTTHSNAAAPAPPKRPPAPSKPKPAAPVQLAPEAVNSDN